MASLPSVVLGFLAALVFAPFLERVVPQTLTAFVTIPFCFLLGAHLWQLLPRSTALRWSRFKFPFMFVGLPAGLLLAGALGPGWRARCSRATSWPGSTARSAPARAAG